MQILSLLTKTLNYLLDPKNRTLLLGIVIAILIAMLLSQCNDKRALKAEVAAQKAETQRIVNNHEAASDSIKQFMVNDSISQAEKQGYQLTIEELKTEYSDLLGELEIEKNKPPKTVVSTEFQINERIDSVPVYVTIDTTGMSLAFNDSAKYSDENYRILTGTIPFEYHRLDDSHFKLVPGLARFDLEQGVGIRLGLFQDVDTKKIMIKAQTEYPGLTFTQLEGADILYQPDNKKIVRNLRKTWALALQAGYHATYDIQNSTVVTGPSVGVGISYSPKFLQWGK